MNRQDMTGSKKKNLFLAGEVGVGKSTAIRKALALLGIWDGKSGQTSALGSDQYGLSWKSIGGFRTVSLPSQVVGESYRVYIESTWEKTPHDQPHLIGIRYQKAPRKVFSAAFERAGVDILNHLPEKPALLLMDEIGLMEDKAYCFQRKVLELLAGPIPVLGVVKPKEGALTNAVREQNNTEVWTITEQNREQIPGEIFSFLKNRIAM